MSLPRATCDLLMADAALGENARLTIDLVRQVVVRPSGEAIGFAIDASRRQMLLEGLDEIGQTLQRVGAIDAFERARAAAQPWLPAISGV